MGKWYLMERAWKLLAQSQTVLLIDKAVKITYLVDGNPPVDHEE